MFRAFGNKWVLRDDFILKSKAAYTEKFGTNPTRLYCSDIDLAMYRREYGTIPTTLHGMEIFSAQDAIYNWISLWSPIPA